MINLNQNLHKQNQIRLNEINSNGVVVQHWILQEKLVYNIGRSKENEIQIINPSISRNQAQITIDVNGLNCCLVDRGSANGTFVDSQPVRNQPAQISEQQLIAFGQYMNHFQIQFVKSSSSAENYQNEAEDYNYNSISESPSALQTNIVYEVDSSKMQFNNEADLNEQNSNLNQNEKDTIQENLTEVKTTIEIEEPEKKSLQQSYQEQNNPKSNQNSQYKKQNKFKKQQLQQQLKNTTEKKNKNIINIPTINKVNTNVNINNQINNINAQLSLSLVADTPSHPVIMQWKLEKNTKKYAGRSGHECQILLVHASINKKHLLVETDSMLRVWVMDLGSINGTTIEDVKVSTRNKVELKVNQYMRIGDYPDLITMTYNYNVYNNMIDNNVQLNDELQQMQVQPQTQTQVQSQFANNKSCFVQAHTELINKMPTEAQSITRTQPPQQQIGKNKQVRQQNKNVLHISEFDSISQIHSPLKTIKERNLNQYQLQNKRNLKNEDDEDEDEDNNKQKKETQQINSYSSSSSYSDELDKSQYEEGLVSKQMAPTDILGRKSRGVHLKVWNSNTKVFLLSFKVNPIDKQRVYYEISVETVSPPLEQQLLRPTTLDSGLSPFDTNSQMNDNALNTPANQAPIVREWTVQKTYSELYALNNQLMQIFSNLPPFPSKSLLKLSEEKFKQRVEMLRRYISYLSKNDVFGAEPTRTFLDTKLWQPDATQMSPVLMQQLALAKLQKSQCQLKSFIYVKQSGLLIVNKGKGSSQFSLYQQGGGGQQKKERRFWSFLCGTGDDDEYTQNQANQPQKSQIQNQEQKNQEQESNNGVVFYQVDDFEKMSLRKIWELNVPSGSIEIMFWQKTEQILILGLTNGTLICDKIHLNNFVLQKHFNVFRKQNYHVSTIVGLYMDPSKYVLLSVSSTDRLFKVYDIVKNKTLQEFHVGQSALQNMLVKERKIYIGNAAGSVFLFSIQLGGDEYNVQLEQFYNNQTSPNTFKAQHMVLDILSSSIYQICFEGLMLKIKLIKTQAKQAEIKLHNKHQRHLIKNISCVAFCKVSHFLIFGTNNGMIYFYDIKHHQTFVSLKAHNGTVWQIKIIQHQRIFISIGQDMMIKVWNIPMNCEFKRQNLLHFNQQHQLQQKPHKEAYNNISNTIENDQTIIINPTEIQQQIT